MLTPDCERLLDQAAQGDGLVIVLTGAGISAESGIPTFRGPEGYWTVGSRVYMPQDLATRATFDRMPEEVWRWYLYRLGVCWQAEPNPAHHAVADLERALADRFLLITQNVDGLHLRAGNSRARTYEIHGSINFMRCTRECTPGIEPIPGPLRDWWGRLDRSVGGTAKDAAGRSPAGGGGFAAAGAPPLDEGDLAHLHCQRCGAWRRPHVLWFDEYYDEEHYRYDSSVAAAARADLVIVVGTSGATNLPNQVAQIAARRGAAIVLVDPVSSPFADLAGRTGSWIKGPAGQCLPPLVTRLADYSRGRPGS